MASVTPESSYLAAILRMHMYTKGNRDHPRSESILACREKLELCVPNVGVLGLQFIRKLFWFVVSDNMFFMRAKILRQNLQQTVLGLLKVNVELLLLFLGIEVKKWALGQTPPPRQRVQNFERLMSQQGAGVRSNFERKRGGRLRRSTSSCPPIPASAWREASWTGQ